MNVTELRCTSCLAPIDPSHGPIQRCIYCGTTLTIGGAPSAAAPGTIRLDDCGPNKIQVIKVIREYTGLGRVTTSGKSAAFRSAPASAPSRGGGAFLEDIGPNKIMVIKVVYDTLRLGLKESKDLVERAPCVIGEHLDADASARLREALRAAGAGVR